LFIENHDQPRSVSSWGNDKEYWDRSAKALATMYFFMQGTPFIYQGQEIGMTNVQFPNIEDYNDVGMKNFYYIERDKGRSHEEIMKIIWRDGRDNSRTPMQWDNSNNAGFTTSDKTWMGVNSNHSWLNVEQQQQNIYSIFHYYKSMIKIRKENEGLIYGDFNIELRENNKVFMYKRQWNNEIFWIVVNLTGDETIFDFNLPENVELILNNVGEVNVNILSPYEARVYKYKN
jgi:alpha-glucosidase